MGPRRPVAGVAVGAAAGWAVLFGSGSLYAAMGGHAGRATVAPALVRAFDDADPTIVWALWLTGLAKLSLAGALVALHRSTGAPRWLHQLAATGFQVAGAAFAAYGVTEAAAGTLVWTRAIAPLSGWGDGRVAVWYALLWGPFWFAGGIAYLAAGTVTREPAPETR